MTQVKFVDVDALSESIRVLHQRRAIISQGLKDLETISRISNYYCLDIDLDALRQAIVESIYHKAGLTDSPF